MKTLIELYDDDPIKNLLASLIFKPPNLIIVSDENSIDGQRKRSIAKFFKEHRQKISIVYYEVNTNQISSIIGILNEIIGLYEEPAFDLTGGKELALIEASFFCREKKIPGFYIDIDNNILVNVFGAESYKRKFSLPELDVRMLLLSGGASLERSDHFQPAMTEDVLISEIMNVFQYSLENPKVWSKHIDYLQQLTRESEDRNGRSLRLSGQREYHKGLKKCSCQMEVMQFLKNSGIVSNLSFRQNSISFSYKNHEFRECLINHGIWLELYLYIVASQLDYFNDVCMSVIIDWDGDEEDFSFAKNEIDLILLKDIYPIFISCKMPMPNSLALSEIKLLSQKFGGSMAKTVVATAADIDENLSLYKRAKELDIAVIDEEDFLNGRVEQILMAVAEGRYRHKY